MQRLRERALHIIHSILSDHIRNTRRPDRRSYGTKQTSIAWLCTTESQSASYPSYTVESSLKHAQNWQGSPTLYSRLIQTLVTPDATRSPIVLARLLCCETLRETLDQHQVLLLLPATCFHHMHSCLYAKRGVVLALV